MHSFQTISNRAEKMIVLKYSQMLLVLVGLSSTRLHEPTNEFTKSGRTYATSAAVAVLTSLCGTTLWQSMGSEFISQVPTFFPFLCGIQSLAIFLSLGLEMQSVKLFQTQLQSIVDDGD